MDTDLFCVKYAQAFFYYYYFLNNSSTTHLTAVENTSACIYFILDSILLAHFHRVFIQFSNIYSTPVDSITFVGHHLEWKKSAMAYAFQLVHTVSKPKSEPDIVAQL